MLRGITIFTSFSQKNSVTERKAIAKKACHVIPSRTAYNGM